MKPFIQRRYKLYRQALLGKLLGDQYLEVFRKNDMTDSTVITDNVYSGSFVEDETWWIAGISRFIISKVNYAFSTRINTFNEATFGTMIYMHKYKDMCAAKVSIVTCLDDTTADVINNLFLRMLRSLGYMHFEFCGKPQYSAGIATRIVKILIPSENTEDDLVYLLQSIDKFNEYMIENNKNSWTKEDLPGLMKIIKNIVIKQNNEKVE